MILHLAKIKKNLFHMKRAFKVQKYIDSSSMFLTSFYNKLSYYMQRVIAF